MKEDNDKISLCDKIYFKKLHEDCFVVACSQFKCMYCTYLDTTSSQINDTFLFHRVLKILTGGRILQISIARCQIEAEIHSFPTMNRVDVVKIGDIKVSVQE